MFARCFEETRLRPIPWNSTEALHERCRGDFRTERYLVSHQSDLLDSGNRHHQRCKNVTLKNTGTAILTISSIAITGTNAGNFAQTHTCGSSLAAGASCGISVTFRPTPAEHVRSSQHQRQRRWQPTEGDAKWDRYDCKTSPGSLTFSTQAIGTMSGAKKCNPH